MKLKYGIFLALFISSSPNAELFWNDLYDEPRLLSLNMDKNNELLGFFKLSLNGDLKLLEIIDGDPTTTGVDSLLSGINMKECNAGHCDSISYIVFNKNTGVLEAITKKNDLKTDTESTKSFRLGLQSIASNDSLSTELSATTSLYDYQIVTDGLMQNNKHWDDSYRLNNAYIKKNMGDKVLMSGLFTTDNVNSGYNGSINAQAVSALGMSINSRDLRDSNSDVERNIFLSLTDESYVEVYKGDQMIDSLVLGSGLNKIDASLYPMGNYVVTIKVKSRITDKNYELEEYVYSSDIKRSYGIGFGLPYNSFESNLEGDTFYMSAFLNSPLTKATSYGVIFDLYGDQVNLGAKLNYNMDFLKLSVEPKLVEDDFSVNLNSAYSGEFSSINNYMLLEEDRFYSSTNLMIRLKDLKSLRLSHRYDNNQKTSNDLEYHELSLSYDKNYRWKGLNIRANYVISNRVERSADIDTTFGVNYSIGFDQSNNFDIGVSLRNNDGESSTFYNVGYQKRLDNDVLQSAFISANSDGKNSHLWDTGVNFDNEAIKGAVRVSGAAGKSNFDVTGNVSANLHSDFSNINVSSSTANSGLIVKLDNNSDDEVRMLSNFGHMTLKNGDNFIPSPAGENIDAAFFSDSNFELSRKNFSTKILENGYTFVDVSVMPTVTVIGRLITNDDSDMSSHLIKNHASETYANKNGYFMLNVDMENPNIIIGDKIIYIDLVDQDSNHPIYLEDIYI
ncbi:TcfC E-set like domain-containing protein [Vibrio sp. R78045]|uniref:TcfC E-set like domain-containing protein n=1 Tax=Vibrio sp. R78045 TaxID=3093868 RepID=UPI0036F2D4ED